MKKLSILFGSYFVLLVGLFLYSYTQVDLSLTMSRASIFQTIEKGFQYIGYFDRPLSTELYVGIVALLFLFYFLFIYFAQKGKLPMSRLWQLILAMGVLLTFAYTAFSYDIFNYIFAAKVIVHYHQNPYAVIPLAFPKDPMLSFMHWTNVPYVYGPLALGFTLPIYLLGLGVFLPTFFLFKALTTVCFFGTVYFLQKLFRQVNPKKEVLGVVLFALNPLVIIETLISAHNDIIMMFFAVMGIYFLLQKKWFWGVLAIIVSALTKQVTVFLLFPVLAYGIATIFKRRISDSTFLWLTTVSMVAGYLFVLTKIGLQPWYTLWFLPFFLLVKLPRFVLVLLIGFTLGVLLRYVPLLWQGDWNGLAPTIMFYVTLTTPVVVLLVSYPFVVIFPKIFSKLYA